MMHRWRRIAASIAASILLWSIAGATPADAAFVDGKRYAAMSDSERAIYMAGLADMMARMVGVSVPEEMQRQARYARCVYNMNETQLREIMDAFMREDPRTLEYNMATNFRAALNVTCPNFPGSRR